MITAIRVSMSTSELGWLLAAAAAVGFVIGAGVATWLRRR